ncbi:hypothetical protein O6H91_15G025700 [Diphasiastrum complanatum]|nr:hypothetical protein O6H91_15G025700 [Diphasiastrum complanatum]
MSTSVRVVENRVLLVEKRDQVLIASDERRGEGDTRTLDLSENLRSLSSAGYNFTGADEFNSASSFKHKNGSQSEDEINRHIGSAAMNPSITSNDFNQDENLDPSSVWKFLNTDDAEIDAKNDNPKSVLEHSIPSQFEAEDALTLSGATCSSGSLPSPHHAIINPNTLEGISLDVQIGPWDEVASGQILMYPESGGRSSILLDANAIQITDACIPCTSEKLISLATSLESDDIRTQRPSLIESSCDPLVEDTLGNYNVSVLRTPLDFIGGSQEIYSLKKDEVSCDTEASLLPLLKDSTLTDCDEHTAQSSIFKGGSINDYGSVPDPALSMSSLSDPEEKLVEAFILDSHFNSHDGAPETSETPPTTSWGVEDNLSGDSFLREVSFRYGANGDSDIFDILNSPTNSPPEKNSLLDALDGETIDPWTSGFQNSKRAASTSSIKSMHQESFLHAYAEANFDLYGQMATSTSSLVSGEDAGDTTSFRTAHSNLESPNSLSSARNSIHADKGAISDDGERSSNGTNHIRTKRLPTLSTIVSNSAEELTPIGTPRDAQSTGAADAINAAQRSYPDRAITYDQYLSDPKVSPQMRWQVLRAKATLERYYEVQKTAAVPSSVELGKSESLLLGRPA